ncbi:MAG: 4Fe-4S dicluster domain-containing protein [Deltaproteobacteria bacterium]|nr:4Fe-4S dicluster domain-containing protein [Deltaproteobacteria bacterium]
MKRRDFFLSLGGISATLASGKKAYAEPKKVTQENVTEFFGVICDVSRCIGCRACEVACATANKLEYMPQPARDHALEKHRKTSFKQRTVVNRYKTSKDIIYVKSQCMHCWQPACSAACLTNAMEKHKEGPVTWNGDKCMGCRYCMIACPFDIPKYEYESNNPRIQKCTMCWERVEKGQKPACVAACPVNAIQFGFRDAIMETARSRIYAHPDKYVHQIYGEKEVGGTGWVYISPVPFTEIGFRDDLGYKPSPEYTTGFLYYAAILDLVVPPMLLGLFQLAKHNDKPYPSESLDASSAGTKQIAVSSNDQETVDKQ